MDIPRPRNAYAMIAVFSALIMPLTHAKKADFSFALAISVGVLALVLMVLFKYSIYQRRTPLVRLDDTTLTYYGQAKSEQRSFPRAAISSIHLSPRPSFWRSSFRFSVCADGECVEFWIPHASASSVTALTALLRDQFRDKFEQRKA